MKVFKIALFLVLINFFVYADQAYEDYTQGEKSITIAERTKFFNMALVEYKKLEGSNASGKLLYNIANTYFQLGEYGQALLYYNRALIEKPRNEKIKANMAVALEKVGVLNASRSRVWEILFFFHHKFSLKERQIAFLFFGIIAVLIWSVYIWRRKYYLRLSGIVITSCWSIFFMSLFWSLYFSSSECVIIKPCMIHRDAGKHYDIIVEKPINSGTKMKIKKDQGDWFKVEVPEKGSIGFINKRDAEII